MIWSIAWKNIWRNKIRSLVVIFAVMIGIFSAIMLVGIMGGWINQRVQDALHNEISHIQIHHTDYMLNEELHFTIHNYMKVRDTIEKIQGIRIFSSRVKMFALAQSDWASTGLNIVGINPEKEQMVTNIHQNLVIGEYFKDEQGLPSIVLGSQAAENLKLLNYEITEEKLQTLDNIKFNESLKNSLGTIAGSRYRTQKDFRIALQDILSVSEFDISADFLTKHFSFYRLRSKITITVQNTNGDFVLLAFRVRGIYKTNNSMFDGMTAFVNVDVLKRETGLGEDDYHEIALLAEDEETGIIAAEKLKEKLTGYNVMSWKELSPELALYSDFMIILDYIYVCIFLLALSFGIINTMLMSVLERVKELGMLMAIGMNKKRVFFMIMLESVFLTLSGAVVGMVFGGILLKSLSQTGINLGMWAEGLEAMGYASVIYPFVPVKIFFGVALLVILTGILSSIWPARKALKLNPADALRTE